MGHDFKKVYIIIVNYNGWQDTIECLESVLKCVYPNYHIIVIDNDSKDNSIDYLLNWVNYKLSNYIPSYNSLKSMSFPGLEKPISYNYFIEFNKNININGVFKNDVVISFISAQYNNGFAAGNNIGIRYAFSQEDCEYIWLLNNDTIVDRLALRNLVSGFEKYNKKEKVGVCGVKILYYDYPDIIQSLGRIRKSFHRLRHIGYNLKDIFDADYEVDDIPGTSMLISKEYINNVGLMPEEYFLYMEETDWNFNGQLHGYKMYTITESKVYHKESKSVGGRYSYKNIYYNTRNRIHFLKKYEKYYYFYLLLFFFYKMKDALFYLITFKPELSYAILNGFVDALRGVYGR